ncbi:helix-turn-helix domain-containing protein [Cuspidothrix issatschenkoi]|uniref:helix-turn-helix domain-containing protein n=1 Tax=Cuspidothrix issatschenkoi TaxID=230752 RepID=UPI001D14F23D|nr:transcriptional regulator [Cuspidothrix issatschenkoi]
MTKTQAVADALIDKGDLTEDEQDYLSLLGMLIYDYEQKQNIIPDIWGVDVLKVLMMEMDLKQRDLVCIFKTESIVSDVLNKKRKLTVEHIQKLGEFFKISPAVFLPKNS